MGIFTDSSDYTSTDEHKWWFLMETALEKDLILRLEKSKSTSNTYDLNISLWTLEEDPEFVTSASGRTYSTKLYNRVKKFIEDYDYKQHFGI